MVPVMMTVERDNTLDKLIAEMVKPILVNYKSELDITQDHNDRKIYLLQIDNQLNKMRKEINALQAKITNVLWMERVLSNEKSDR